LPVVDQVQVPAPQSRCSVHVVLPGDSSQNLYCGDGHPVEVALKVTAAPGAWGEGVPGLTAAEAHAAEVKVKVPSQYVSYEEPVPFSRTHTPIP
jgi:hypothetical protein